MFRYRPQLHHCTLAVGFIGFLLFCEFAAQAQSIPQIEIRADRDYVQILDPFEVEVEVTASDTASVQLPEVSEQFGPFEVLGHRDALNVPLDDDSGQRQWIRRLTLETMETGTLEIPSLEVFVRDAENSQSKPAAREPIRLATKPLKIKVATVLEAASDPSKFNDIRDVIDVPEPNDASMAFVYWIIGGVAGGFALVSLAAAAFFVARRKRWTTPADWAKGEIAALPTDSSKAMDDLEKILRQYVEFEFGFPATALGVDQLQRGLVDAGASSDCVDAVEQLISKSSEFKFAGLRLSDRDVTEAKSTVLSIVEQLDSIPTEVN